MTEIRISPEILWSVVKWTLGIVGTAVTALIGALTVVNRWQTRTQTRVFENQVNRMLEHGDTLKSAFTTVKSGLDVLSVKLTELKNDFMYHESKCPVREMCGSTVSGGKITWEPALSHDEELAILHDISIVIQGSKTLKNLLETLGPTISHIKDLYVHPKLGVFLVDTEDPTSLILSYTYGQFSDEFLEHEQRIPIGSCLCGRAAVTGEVLTDQNCFHDSRHERFYESMEPHGHYIVPLRSNGDIVGVMFLYTDVEQRHSEQRVKLFKTLGSLIGMAIKHFQLKEGA